MAAPKGIEGVSGSVILPSGIPSHTLARRNLAKHKHLNYRFIDPQLYLYGLNAAMCRKVCASLATYPWFDVGKVARFDSSLHSQPDYLRKLRANIHRIWPQNLPTDSGTIERLASQCINVQLRTGCDAVLLPSPLIIDQSSDISLQMEWLDIGYESLEAYQTDLPVYATIAISDVAVRAFNPESNSLLDILIDQLTSRSFAGVYVILEQNTEFGYYCNHPNTVGALLRLTWGLKQGGIKDVVMGPMGLLGFLCLGAGADAWAAGWYRGERRIKLADMETNEGRSVPTYYSHSLASEIHTEHDLDAISKLDVFDEIADLTSDSKGLLQALKKGTRVKSVPEWEYRTANVTAAKAHFVRSVAMATHEVSLLSQTDVALHMYKWLLTAEALSVRIKESNECNRRTELDHQANWLSAFVAFQKNSGL